MGRKPARRGCRFLLFIADKLSRNILALPMPNRQILLVEDDPDCAHLAMVAFKQIIQSPSVHHVTDGAQALDYLESQGEYAGRDSQPPTVVLLDLKMPRLNGFDVLERMRSLPTLRLQRVVVLSSSAHDRDVQRAYELGASGYVVKSISFDTYCSSLKAIWEFFGVHNHPPHTSPSPA